MTQDPEPSQIPGAIAAVRRAFAALTSGFSSWKIDLESEIDQLLSQLRDKDAQLAALNEKRMLLEEQLVTMRTRDSLTGLPNREAFIAGLDERLDPEASAGRAWVVVVRFWQFERLRHSLGASVAAGLMVEVAARIEVLFGHSAGISRVGEQELGLLIDKEHSRTPGEIGNKLITHIEDRFRIGKQGIYLHAVIGLADTEGNTDTGAELLDRASLAADEAIVKGSKWSAFREEQHEEVVSLLQLEADLQGAVENGELRLHYQPIVNVVENEIVGLEALLRWFHPSGTVIMPDHFIPIAESRGNMGAISEWVFRTGVEQIRKWHRTFDIPFYISMNLTPRDLNAEFCAMIFRLIREAGIAPEQVGVEITETAVVRDFRFAADLIGQLSGHGVRVLLDDFGTGYSSLSYLRELPFSYVKIDKSFVHRMAFDSRDFGMVRSIISLVQYLEMECVAEGIETQEQLDLIAMIDCNYWQGNFLAKPMQESEIEGFLRQFSATPGRRPAS